MHHLYLKIRLTCVVLQSISGKEVGNIDEVTANIIFVGAMVEKLVVTLELVSLADYIWPSEQPYVTFNINGQKHRFSPFLLSRKFAKTLTKPWWTLTSFLWKWPRSASWGLDGLEGVFFDEAKTLETVKPDSSNFSEAVWAVLLYDKWKWVWYFEFDFLLVTPLVSI